VSSWSFETAKVFHTKTHILKFDDLKRNLAIARAVNQTILIRENFGDTVLGTCKESIDGGEHYRVWRQNGSAVSF